MCKFQKCSVLLSLGLQQSDQLSPLVPLRHKDTFGPFLVFLIFNEYLVRENMDNPESTELVLTGFLPPTKTDI